MAKPSSPDKRPKTAERTIAADKAKTSDGGADRASQAPESAAPEAETSAMPARRPIDLIESAKRQLKELTGYPVDSVSEFGRTEDGWKLTVTVVELGRIPPATDVLAEYIVGLNRMGDIVDYRRGRRYFRDQVGEPT